MPELPEVETMRRGIAPVVGRTIVAVRRPPSPLQPVALAPSLPRLRRRLVGKRIAAVGRMGKRLLIRMERLEGEEEGILVIEPRMTGRILLGEPDDRKHLRLVLALEGESPPALSFWDSRGLGAVRLLSAARLATELGPARLGPDALGICGRQLAAGLGRSRRPIKVALLDQRAVAGIGNIYASEILHRCGVHPGTVCHRLTLRQWQRIAGATHEVLEEAIRCNGSTLADGAYAGADGRPGGFAKCHRVYQRAGELCGGCRRRRIERLVQCGRSSFFCPHCQPRLSGEG